MTIVIAGLITALLASQGGGQPQTAPPAIRGTVVNAKTQAPIADARVTLVEASLDVRTGPDGRFEFARVPPKTYTLTVSTIGYIFVRRRIEVQSNVDIDLTIPLAEGTGTYQEQITVAET